VKRRIADNHRIRGGAAQMASQAVVVKLHTRVRLPRVFVDRGGLAELLGEARRTDLPAEHTGLRGFWRWRAILSAVVATTPPRVVARCRSHLCVAPSPGIYDVAGVAVPGLTAHVKDALPDRRPDLVSRLPRGAARVDGCLLTLSVVSSRALG
jgi:hypothetical protein